MFGRCPNCAKDSRLTRQPRTEMILVKGEDIPVEVDTFQCLECGTRFVDPALDPQVAALREYRRRRDMLQPEDIRDFRIHYGLSQRELSGLLGFGGATLSRYENGALQDEAHDTLLRLIREAASLLVLVERDRVALSPEKRAGLTARLREQVELNGLIRLIDRRGLYGEPNLFNGERLLDLTRLTNVVRLFTFGKNLQRGRLNRLLFYADFKHYQGHGQGITGLVYTRRASGPAPDGYEIIYQRLAALDPALTVEDDPAANSDEVLLRSQQEPDRSLLSLDELRTLIEVEAYFKPFSAEALARHARGEEGWQRTPAGEYISYKYAGRLRI